MEGIKKTFAQCKSEQRPALVTYVTAGFPTADETPDIMLGMEAGGAGRDAKTSSNWACHSPTQSQTDQLYRKQTQYVFLSLETRHAPSIPRSNTDGLRVQQALKNGVTVTSCLQMVRDARKRGLRAPVLLMGYYNPLLSYGEERMLTDSREAGVNGFIVVDLPPEEAVRFRNFCTKGG
ncbi:hypothetical protein LTR16_007341, partial [Cryomyces antarcticus]